MTNDTCISGDFKMMHLAVGSSKISSLSLGKVIHPNNLFVPCSILPFHYYCGCRCGCFLVRLFFLTASSFLNLLLTEFHLLQSFPCFITDIFKIASVLFADL